MKDSHTTAEVRAATDNVVKKGGDLNTMDLSKAIVDELTKPQYRDDLPVLYGVGLLGFAGGIGPHHSNLRPLIETGRVMEMADKQWEQYPRAKTAAREWWKSGLDAYCQESPDEQGTEGGRDE